MPTKSSLNGLEQTITSMEMGMAKACLSRAGEMIEGSVPGGYSFQKCKYEDSAGRLLMEKWLVEGLGHAWSGSPSAGRFADPKGPNASEEMWRFFCDTTLESLDHPASRPALRGALTNLFHRAVSISSHLSSAKRHSPPLGFDCA